jgi:hypothetical protein
MTAPAQKGFALDDTTFHNCSDRIPTVFPHTTEKVTSIRLFKAWEADWPDSERLRTWDALTAFAQANNAKFLVGTQVTCNETADDADWELVKQFLVKIGVDHVMGVAIGNELELFWKHATLECIDKMWAKRYAINKTISRIAELDKLPGFDKVSVTSVFGAYALAGVGNVPFVNIPNATVNDYLSEVHQKYGRRWVFTFNIYSYFDTGNHLDPGPGHQCNAALKMSTCLGGGCLVSFIGIAARTKMQQLTGNPDDTFWLGETGWSTPMADTLPEANAEMGNCTEWSKESRFRTFYKSFLDWDLQMDGAHRGPDHVFYFAVRDSLAFGETEYFGLVTSCDATQCKLQQQDGEAEIIV